MKLLLHRRVSEALLFGVRSSKQFLPQCLNSQPIFSVYRKIKTSSCFRMLMSGFLAGAITNASAAPVTYVLDCTVTSDNSTEFPQGSTVDITVTFDDATIDSKDPVNDFRFDFAQLTFGVGATATYVGGSFTATPTDSNPPMVTGGYDSGSGNTTLYFVAMDSGDLPAWGDPAGFSPPIVFIDLTFTGDQVGDDTPGSPFTGVVGDSWNNTLFASGQVMLEPSWDTAVTLQVTGIEKQESIDPNDTDGDGLKDDWERALINADPNDAYAELADVQPTDDPDNDGLDNSGEQTAQTNPLNRDTDGDYFADGYEIGLTWDPLVAGTTESAHSQNVIATLLGSTTAQESCGLFPDSSISDLSLGGAMIEVDPTSGNPTLTFPIQHSQDLGEWISIPAEQCPTWQAPAANGTRFYRVRFQSALEPSMLQNGLLCHLPMNGNLLDVSGNGFDGNQDGDINGPGSGLTIDRFGNADSAYVFYNSQYAQIEVPEIPRQYAVLPEVTVCLWVQVNQSYTDNRYVAGNFFWGNREGWGIMLNPTQGFYFEAYIAKDDQYSNPHTWLGAMSGQQPELGKWYHLAGMFSAKDGHTSLKLYIDGALAATKEIVGEYPYRDSGFFGMGADRARGQVLTNGRADELRVYSRLLSPREIRALAADR